MSCRLRCVAQFGRALRSGRRGRRFKSCRIDSLAGAPQILFSKEFAVLFILVKRTFAVASRPAFKKRINDKRGMTQHAPNYIFLLSLFYDLHQTACTEAVCAEFDKLLCIIKRGDAARRFHLHTRSDVFLHQLYVCKRRACFGKAG